MLRKYLVAHLQSRLKNSQGGYFSIKLVSTGSTAFSILQARLQPPRGDQCEPEAQAGDT
jgi:hypothetical protein